MSLRQESKEEARISKIWPMVLLLLLLAGIALAVFDFLNRLQIMPTAEARVVAPPVQSASSKKAIVSHGNSSVHAASETPGKIVAENPAGPTPEYFALPKSEAAEFKMMNEYTADEPLWQALATAYARFDSLRHGKLITPDQLRPFLESACLQRFASRVWEVVELESAHEGRQTVLRERSYDFQRKRAHILPNGDYFFISGLDEIHPR